MKVPELPKEPVDGFTIEFWTFEPVSGYRPGPRRHLRIFVLNETWASWKARKEWQAYHAHRPGDGDRDGAPFDADWMHINQSGDRMQFEGRSCGWDALMKPYGSAGRVYSNAEKWGEWFATREEALEAFRKHAELYIEREREKIASAQATLEEVLKVAKETA